MGKFKDICDKLADTLEKKNQAYGDSYRRPGPISKASAEDALKVRIDDKIRRLQAFSDKTEFESEYDTWQDLAGYCVLMMDLLGDEVDKVDKPGHDWLMSVEWWVAVDTTGAYMYRYGKSVVCAITPVIVSQREAESVANDYSATLGPISARAATREEVEVALGRKRRNGNA